MSFLHAFVAPRWRACVLGAVLCTLFGPAASWAGNFSVSPVRLYMGVKDRAIAVTVENEGSTPVTVQAESFVWAQTADGKDKLTPTDDLIVSPPIAKIAPGGRQVLRLARIGAPDMSQQLTYRLIVSEVPEVRKAKQTEEDKKLNIQFHLAMSMPVFITPPAAKRELECQITKTSPAAAATPLQAQCKNTGTAYAQIRQISFKRGEQNLGTFDATAKYILPGATRTVELKPTVAGSVPPAGPAQARLQFDDGKTLDLNIQLP
jgi:fimbrial chaperone protein